MPITYQVIPEKRLGILIHSGTIPDDEFLSFYSSLYESNQIDKSFNILVDLRNAESSVRSPEALQKLAKNLRIQYEVHEGTRPKVAVVASKDISFGLARMYESYSGTAPRIFAVFRTVSAALEWLELPESLAGEIYGNVPP